VYRSLVAACILTACGAPIRPASEVGGIFRGEAATLDKKAEDLCTTLAARSEPPTTQALQVEMEGCQEPGQAAVNYAKAEQFYFADLNSADARASDAVHKAVRGQVWLNKNLLDLATLVGRAMGQKAGAKPGEIELPDSAIKELAGLVKPKLTLLEPPNLDMVTLTFSMLINIQIEGALVANHDIQIDGKVIGNAIAVTIATTKDQPFEVSLLKNFQSVVLVVPHASDVYVDAFIDVNVNRLGLDEVVETQLSTFFSSGLKSMVDGLMVIGQ